MGTRHIMQSVSKRRESDELEGVLNGSDFLHLQSVRRAKHARDEADNVLANVCSSTLGSRSMSSSSTRVFAASTDEPQSPRATVIARWTCLWPVETTPNLSAFFDAISSHSAGILWHVNHAPPTIPTHNQCIRPQCGLGQWPDYDGSTRSPWTPRTLTYLRLACYPAPLALGLDQRVVDDGKVAALPCRPPPYSCAHLCRLHDYSPSHDTFISHCCHFVM